MFSKTLSAAQIKYFFLFKKITQFILFNPLQGAASALLCNVVSENED